MATMQFQAGQRWDQVSVKMFGSPDYYDLIIAENIELVEDMIKAGGLLTAPLVLTVPEIPEDISGVSELPPWRVETT